MIKKERADFVLKELTRLYPNPPIPLDHKDPFTLLIAVLLSAQCTDERVNKVTPHLFSLADNPFSMQTKDALEVEDIIRPCGLAPRKSRAIVELSKILVKNFSGEVPKSFEELEKLPGVGHKTASVVMSQDFGVPSMPVDTHIHRLAQRWGLSSGKNVVQTEKDLKSLFPKNSWNKLHLQIIYYGREYCQARKCFGLDCFICSNLYPKRKKAVLHKS